MKVPTLLTAMFMVASVAYTQKVSDILDSGIPVSTNDRIYLIKDGATFKYDVGRGTSRDFIPYTDSSIFLTRRGSINIFLQPLNPLRFSYDTSIKYVMDPINEEADKAFASITSLLSTVIGSNKNVTAGGSEAAVTPAPKKKPICQCATCEMGDIKDDLHGTRDILARDPKVRMSAQFTMLRDLDFVNMNSTNMAVGASRDSIKLYRRYFQSLDSAITELEDGVNSFNCSRDDSMIAKYVLIEILNDVKSSYNTKYARFKNLESAFKMVEAAADKASNPSPGGEVWYQKPITVDVNRNTIPALNLIVNHSGLELKDDEIVTVAKSEAYKRVLRFRRFQTFLPEVSAGVAYSFLSFPKYGVTRNEITGEDTVSSAGEESFKKISFTAMINFVLYTSSNVRPFIQLGVGAKSDYPTLFLGTGARFSVAGRTIAVSFGAATTWIKTLNKLQIGSEVSGTSELEQDITHELKWPKPYLGIQLGF